MTHEPGRERHMTYRREPEMAKVYTVRLTIEVSAESHEHAASRFIAGLRDHTLDDLEVEVCPLDGTGDLRMVEV